VTGRGVWEKMLEAYRPISTWTR